MFVLTKGSVRLILNNGTVVELCFTSYSNNTTDALCACVSFECVRGVFVTLLDTLCRNKNTRQFLRR